MSHPELVIDVLNPDTYASASPDTCGFPLDQYRYLREEAPVFKQSIADEMSLDEIWVVSRHEDVMAIDRDAKTWSNANGYLNVWHFNPVEPTQGGKPGMITMDGEEHRRNRKTISTAFTPNVVKRFEDEFRAFTHEILDAALSKGTFDFVEDVAVRMPLYAITDLLGVPNEDRDKFLSWVRVLAAPTDPNYTPNMEELFHGFTSLTAYGTELAEKCRQNPGDDLMSKIVASQDEYELSDDELMGFTVLLSAAGSDTTRNALAHGLHALIHNPEQMAWLREQDGMPETAIQEIVRFTTPVIHMNRFATQDVELHGQVIKAGERVSMIFPAANYDDTVFDAPERLDLTRNPNPHLGFGRGPHVCLGRHIAAIEIRILFEELLARTSDIQQAGDIHYVRDNFVHGVYQLPVSVTPA